MIWLKNVGFVFAALLVIAITVILVVLWIYLIVWLFSVGFWHLAIATIIVGLAISIGSVVTVLGEQL